jgi:acyl-CoA synthetase (AMP-forming)/AMP-acid ligase II
LATGDRGFVRAGELFVWGREKDTIVVRGANHAAEQLERALEGLPGIRPGGVMALAKDARDGDGALTILAERCKGAHRTADAGVAVRIRERLLATTGVAATDVVLLPPGTLPRTSSGKLRRAEARARQRAGTLAPPHRVGPLLLTRARLRGLLARWGLRRAAPV